MAFSSGKHALAICDRCGRAVRYQSLRPLTINECRTDIMVCNECWEPDHPQYMAGKNFVAETEALRHPRPERNNDRNIRWGWRPVYSVVTNMRTGQIGVQISEAKPPTDAPVYVALGEVGVTVGNSFMAVSAFSQLAAGEALVAAQAAADVLLEGVFASSAIGSVAAQAQASAAADGSMASVVAGIGVVAVTTPKIQLVGRTSTAATGTAVAHAAATASAVGVPSIVSAITMPHLNIGAEPAAPSVAVTTGTGAVGVVGGTNVAAAKATAVVTLGAAIAHGKGNLTAGKASATATAGSVTVTATSVTRDPLQQPFASNSIWNTSIGSGAVYVAANLQTVPAGDVWSPMPQIDDEILILSASSPLVNVNYSSAGWSGASRCSATGGLLTQVPIPNSYVLPSTNGNASAAVLRADGRTIAQMQPLTRCSAGGQATAYVTFPDVDLYGAGITGAHGGSGLSAIGGSIRLGELRPGQQGPKHVLKVNVYAKAALYKGTTYSQCYRWPATGADGYAVGWYGTDGNNTNTAMKMGALLAIPASTNIASLGLETEPGLQLAWTLQNYGAYIVDDTYGGAFAFNAEIGPNGSKRVEFQNDFGYALEMRVNDNQPWSRDIQRLVGALYVVNNNSATSIGGGGTPRQPAPPPIAP